MDFDKFISKNTSFSNNTHKNQQYAVLSGDSIEMQILPESTKNTHLKKNNRDKNEITSQKTYKELLLEIMKFGACNRAGGNSTPLDKAKLTGAEVKEEKDNLDSNYSLIQSDKKVPHNIYSL